MGCGGRGGRVRVLVVLVALVVVLWMLLLTMLAGFDVGKFFELVQLPIAWGGLVLGIVALAVLTKTDIVARIWARGADFSIDVPDNGEEADDGRD